MKKMYKTPAVTVEELLKADVLCASTELNTGSGSSGTSNKTDNINQTFKTLGDISSLL